MQIRLTNVLKNETIENRGIQNNTVVTNVNRNPMQNRATKSAVSVELSRSGRNKARMLKESERSKKSDVMQQAEQTIDNIIDKVRSGGKLSKEEERIFNDELKNMSSQQYSDMKNMRLSQEDVLQELKDNFMQRQKLFADMQEQVEQEQTAQNDLTDNVKLMTSQQDQENKKKLIEILKESLDEEEEQSGDAQSKKAEDNTKPENFDVETGSSDETPTTDAQMHASGVIGKNADQIAAVKKQTLAESAQERMYAKNLDEDYERVMDFLDHEDISNEEKLQSYEDYLNNSKYNAFQREVYRVKKNFDQETWLIAKIQFLSHNDIQEVMQGDLDRSQIGTEFIKKFLI